MLGLASVGAILCTGVKAQTDSQITVDAGVIKNHITPWMIGSCIEDVNHEIYGGLYAQRIFGESFEEPPIASSPVVGWTAYGGDWRFEDNSLVVNADSGAKLLNDTVEISDGVIEAQVKLKSNVGTNAAILVRVTDPHTGADNWNGYEIAVSARDQNVAIHRHHHDWHLLKLAPAKIPVGRWIAMRVVMHGPTISLYIDNGATPSIEFTDSADPMLRGRVGVRTWETDASFRNMSVSTEAPAGKQELALKPVSQPGTGVSGMWDPVASKDASVHYTWDSEDPYNSSHSQCIELTGSGYGGVANRGLNRWGIAIRRIQKFTGSLYLRQKDFKGTITVALQSEDGSQTFASLKLPAISEDWKRYEFTLTSTGNDLKGRFAIFVDRPGKVWVDQVTLMPTGADLFHGLPVRADIANGLKHEGIRFLRYGGTMVNAPTYRFKDMIGDRDRRPQVNGNWYPYSTNGFGIEDFVHFCRDAHIEPAFAINIDETAEDAANMVEYLNGAADTPWGKKRAENGHPEPYGVRYIEIGNEEAIDGKRDWYQHYLERFEALEPAMHAKDRALQLVIAAWWRSAEPMCREITQKLSGKAALWDVHVGGDGLRDGEEVDRIFTQMRSKLQEWSPGCRIKACIFEENGGRHDMQRALGHAAILNAAERHGDFVQMDCPANCLQPWLQNDNGWDQGQLYFTPSAVWGMPPYYSQQMAAANYLPLRMASTVECPNKDLDVTAVSNEDGNRLVLKVVNLGSTSHRTQISLNGFSEPASIAKTWTLAGELTAANSPTDPQKIRPVASSISGVHRQFEYEFPPYSYTIISLDRGQ